jgi:tetratricopeptide (TPR) repeat protein
MFEMRRLPLFVAVATFLFHGALVLSSFPSDLQFSKYPWAAAQHLANELPPERALDLSPLYFYVHAAATALSGRPVAGTGLEAPAVVLLQLVATAASAALLLLLLQRFFTLRVALAGTAAFVSSRGVVIYTAVLEPEAFLLLFLVAFLYFCPGSAGRHRLLAGVALALAVSVRPTALPLIAAVPLYFRVNRGRGRWLHPAATVLAPVGVVLLALSVRNGVAAGTFTPLGMNPGFVFYEGNNPLSSGRSAVYPPLVGELKQEIPDHPDNPHLTYRLIAERATGRDLTVGEANEYWRRKAVSFIADHPVRAVRRVLHKGYLVLHDFRAHDLIPAERFDRRLRQNRIPAVPFALVAAMAVGGAVLSLPRWRPLLLVYALLGGQVASMLVFYVSERQRLAALPAFVFFACAALSYVSGSPARVRQLSLAWAGVLAVALMVPNHVMREDRHLWTAYEASDRAWMRAIELRDEGRLAEAATSAAAGYAAAPWLRDYARPSGVSFSPDGFDARALGSLSPVDRDPSLRFDRAQLLLAAGRLDEAEALLTRLIADRERFDRIFVGSSEPRYYLARIELLRGQGARAAELLEEALAAAPGDPFVLAGLAALTGEARHRRQIERYFGELDAAFLIGVAQLESGRSGEAVRNLSDTMERLPELWRAKIYLAAALGADGEAVRASLLYKVATATRSDPAVLEERIVPVFASVARTTPSDPRGHFEHGLVLAQFGRFQEALAALETARALDPRPEFELAITEVERMRSLSTLH